MTIAIDASDSIVIITAVLATCCVLGMFAIVALAVAQITR